MTTEILNGQPPQPADTALLKAYHDAVIKQADLYVDLAKELLKLELAISGIYAAALKLVTERPPDVPLVAAAFGFWLLALLATLRTLFPHRYTVLHDAVQRVGRAGTDGRLSIEEFFQSPRPVFQRSLVPQSGGTGFFAPLSAHRGGGLARSSLPVVEQRVLLPVGECCSWFTRIVQRPKQA